MFDGHARSYPIQIPTSYDDAESVIVVIALHSHPGLCLDLKLGTDLDKKSDQEGIIEVYPNSYLAPLLKRNLFFYKYFNFHSSFIWPYLELLEILRYR